jgi:hypothetical protein
MCVRQRATLEVGLCDRHRSRRLIGMLSAWGFFFFGIACFFAAAYLDGDYAVIAGLTGGFSILVSIIGGLIVSRVVHAKKIEREHAFVGGICEDFLAEIPAWRE